MTRFTAGTQAGAVIDAPRERVWQALTDPTVVASLTPFIKTIRAHDDHWCWEMTGIKVAGLGIAPAFTEKMSYDEPSRIDFRHDPPVGATERSAVEGWYALSEHEAGTRLETSMEITVDLPLPRIAGGAVRSTMCRVIEQMGDRFSKNLLAHLGAHEVA